MVYPKIRDLREDKDWTQQKIADLLFINRRTYSAYENGVNAMNPEVLARLARIHETSVDYLLGLTDRPNPYPRKKS
jgi:transcriptional regulator with XRE-family HTH domain